MKFIILSSFIIALFSSGCATVIKGYESEVVIHNVSDSLQVFTSHGVKLHTEVGILEKKVYSPKSKMAISYFFDDSTKKVISLRSNREHILFLKEGEKEYKLYIYPKLHVGWLALGVILGGLPAVVDGITGNWNDFDDIDFVEIKKIYAE